MLVVLCRPGYKLTKINWRGAMLFVIVFTRDNALTTHWCGAMLLVTVFAPGKELTNHWHGARLLVTVCKLGYA